MRLSDSVKLIGICTDMCPEYERVRRIVEEDVKAPECVCITSESTLPLLKPHRRPKPNTYHANNEYQTSRGWSKHTHDQLPA